MVTNSACKPPGMSAREFLISRVDALTPADTGHLRHRLVDAVLVGTGTFYAAVEVVDLRAHTRTVSARVVKLVRGPFADSAHNIGWTSWSETEMPACDACPARILDLLTPTMSSPSRRWRSRCRQRLPGRTPPALCVGAVLRLAERQLTVTACLGRRGWQARGADGRLYRIARSQAKYACDVILPAGAGSGAGQLDLFAQEQGRRR